MPKSLSIVALGGLALTLLVSMVTAFMVPMSRLRKPDDVHHRYRDAPVGPNLLSTGPLPAATLPNPQTITETPITDFVVDDTFYGTFDEKEEMLVDNGPDYDFKNIAGFADDIMIGFADEITVIDPPAVMDHQMQHEEEVREMDAVVMMQDKEEAAHKAPRAQLLKDVAFHLIGQVRQQMHKLRSAIIFYFSQIMEKADSFIPADFSEICAMNMKRAKSSLKVSLEKIRVAMQQAIVKGKVLMAKLQAHQADAWGFMEEPEESDFQLEYDANLPQEEPVLMMGAEEESTLKLFVERKGDAASLTYMMMEPAPIKYGGSVVAEYDYDGIINRPQESPLPSLALMKDEEDVAKADAKEHASSVTLLDVLSTSDYSDPADPVMTLLHASLLSEEEEKVEEEEKRLVVEDVEEDEDDNDDHMDGGMKVIDDEEVIEKMIAVVEKDEELVENELAAPLMRIEMSEEEQNKVDKLRWRLMLLPLSQTAWVEEGDLLRYVREYQLIEESFAALKKTCEWREKVDIDRIMAKDYSASPLSKELFWFHSDKEGTPVLVFRSALHTPNSLTSEKYMDYLIYLLEKGRKDFGLGYQTQLTLLVDRMGSGIGNQDPFLVMDIVPLLQAHFPSYLKATYIAPINWFFKFIWTVFGSVLAPSTYQRFHLLDGPDFEVQLATHFNTEYLPSWLGGALAGYEGMAKAVFAAI